MKKWVKGLHYFEKDNNKKKGRHKKKMYTENFFCQCSTINKLQNKILFKRVIKVKKAQT